MKPLQRPLWVLASLEGKSKMFSGETVEDQESNAAKFKAGLVEYYKENPKGRGKNRYSANNFVRIKSCSNSGWIGKGNPSFVITLELTEVMGRMPQDLIRFEVVEVESEDLVEIKQDEEVLGMTGGATGVISWDI